jgi:hypothetical protein
MTPEEALPPNTLAAMLKSLAKNRNQDGMWKDAEEEVSGTQVFKIGEALRPFYIVAAQTFDPPLETLRREQLVSDTSKFFSIVKKDGFFPSPYSPVATKDQYTDFAAFVLDFGDIVLKYPNQTSLSERTIRAPARACIQKAFAFLTQKDAYLEDDNGVRWAGTTTHTRLIKGKVKEFFTDTYFTATVMLALHRALEMKSVVSSQEAKDFVTSLIQKAGGWIAGRERRGLLTGDEDRKNQQLFYSTWGIRALAETYHLQGSAVRDLLKAVVATYIDALRQVISEKGVAIGQDYIPVCSTELNEPLSYEERTSWVGVILTLISVARIQELESTLEGTEYRKVLDDVVNGFMALRDPVTDLWYRDYFITSIHSFLAEALIARSGLPARLGYTYEVGSGLVGRVVAEAIADTRFVKFMQQLISEKMSKIAAKHEQERKLSAGFSQLGTPPTKFKSKGHGGPKKAQRKGH